MSKFKYNLAVIGLGYVGLPLAVEAANSKLNVAGYDINESCLLYTSPSPRDLSTSRMPSSA